MLWCCHMKSYGQANLLPYGADMQIIFAREFLKEVRMKPDQVKYLVTNARNGMCQGHRAELFAVKAAQACAPLALNPPGETFHRLTQDIAHMSEATEGIALMSELTQDILLMSEFTHAFTQGLAVV